MSSSASEQTRIRPALPAGGRRLVGLLACLCLAASCSLLPSAECPPVEHYTFAETDRQWQQFAVGTQWVFENQRHQRRTYRIYAVAHEAATMSAKAYSPAIIADYYYESWAMYWERTDSATQYAGKFYLERKPVAQDRSKTYVYSEAVWNDFIGTEYNDKYRQLYTGGLDFEDITRVVWRSVTSKGIVYPHVKSFVATALAIQKLPAYELATGRKFRAKQVDYDQQAGVIRFITLNGDVWERVP